ncbi:MAG: 4-hydroxythreonine-4-phosphate dehydrogenase PdxA [Gammaproteobacteria bacterium]|nr:4-hydroxythreonine-4-phosphate dehydrogenase PdxA [Gammaproteobacteria bacterium]
MTYCIAVTAGEPAGVGPDIILALAQHALPRPMVVIANFALFKKRARQLDLSIEFHEVGDASADEPRANMPGHIWIKSLPLRATVTAGKLDATNSPYVLDCLREAAQGCVKNRYAAMVTAPVHKGVINDAGIAFTGHTEFLAECVGGYPVMMLACPRLKVALVTTHLPLNKIAQAITHDTVKKTLEILHKDLQTRFNIAEPRILIAGVNPHAGEQGHLGTEERDILQPVINELRAQGMNISDPLPADTLFTSENLNNTDAFLCMYHDQGLPVLKALGFGEAVNVTLGLPIIRTSVDHGTALALAGTGKAKHDSLLAAFELASSLLPQ